ncbi:MAG: CHAT domain-containing protein [Saprospiraceae bacterium]
MKKCVSMLFLSIYFIGLTFSQNERVAIDPKELLTYQWEELDQMVHKYYENIDIKDTFDFAATLKKFTSNMRFKGVDLNNIVSNYDWNAAAQKVDWNAALRHIDFNDLAAILCNSTEGLLDSLPGISDGKAMDSLLVAPSKPSFDMQNCFRSGFRPNQMMAYIDLPCLMQKMQQEGIALDGSSVSKAPNKEEVCKLMDCVDLDRLMEQIDMNCTMSKFNFNELLQKWKMGDSIGFLDSTNTNKQSKTVSNPFFDLINPDSIKEHITVVFEDFFDASDLRIIDENFIEHTFGTDLRASDSERLKSTLELMTITLPQLFNENKDTRYLISALWLFYDIQLAHSQSNYEALYTNQLLLKDILIYFIEHKSLNQLNQVGFFNELFTEDLLWVMLSTYEENIGHALSELGKYTEALIHFEKALAILTYKEKEVDPLAVEKKYFGSTFTTEEQSKLKKEFEIDEDVLYLWAINAFDQKKDPRSIERLLKQKRYKEAVACYLLLKDLLLKSGEKNQIVGRDQLHNISAHKPKELLLLKAIYQRSAEIVALSGAKEKGNAEYDFYQRAAGEIAAYRQHLMISFLYNNIGGHYYQLNNFELANTYLDKTWNRIKQLNHLDYFIPASEGYGNMESNHFNKLSVYANLVSNLAQVHMAQKNYKLAIECLEDAIPEIKNKKNLIERHLNSGEKATSVAESLFGIYTRLSQLYLINNDTLRASKYIFKCDSIARGTRFPMNRLLANLYHGHYCQKTNKLDSALYYWAQAKKNAESISPAMNVLSEINLLLGRTYEQLGKSRQAKKYYQRCEKMARARSQYAVLNYLYTLQGVKYSTEEQYPKALSSFEKAIAMVEDNLFGYTLGEGSRQQTLENSYTAYEGAMMASLKLNQEEKAFKFLQQSKARTLNELLATKSLTDSDVPISLQNERKDIITALNLTQVNGAMSPSSNRLDRKQSELVRRLRNVNAQIRALVPAYEKLLHPNLATIASLQEVLLPGQAFIEYALGKYAFAFVITKAQVAVFDLGAAGVIDHELSAFKNMIYSRNQGTARSRNRISLLKISKTTKTLYAQLFKSIESSGMLAEIQDLIIAPDQKLYNFPFELLFLKEKKQPTFTIRYLQSATTLVALNRDQSKDRKYDKALLVLGKSDFKEYPQLSNLKKVDRNNFTKILSQSDFLFEENLTLSKIKDINFKKYRQVYISTHGEINSTPELSYLALTKSQLSLYNMMDLDLQNELMILSACQTAKGDFQRGAGVMGFTRGLMYAGVESLIISLWPVDDEATDEFFKVFFKQLDKHKSVRAALMTTKRNFQQREDYNDPSYWAGFVLFGT